MKCFNKFNTEGKDLDIKNLQDTVKNTKREAEVIA